MRYALVLLIATISAAVASGQAPGPAAIEALLLQRSWLVLGEYTNADVPSDKASRFTWQLFRRGPAIVGRSTNLIGGLNCEFEVTVHADGFEAGRGARACNPQTAAFQLQYDPADARFPFKYRSEGQRWWLGPLD